MSSEHDPIEVKKILNELRNKRGLMIFLGGNYEKDGPILNTLNETIRGIEVDNEENFIPIIAKEVFNELDPSKIHEESLRLLHNCGFAVIDITNPAGQLMELERARDYGIVTFVSYGSSHPSKMPVTLSKVMEEWGLGYIFRYEDINGLKKFVKSMLLINHSKGKTSEEIVRTIIGEIPENLLFLTSVGVLNSEKEKAGEIKDLLVPIKRKVIITGWDFKTRGEETAEKYGVESMVCENCILYTKSNNKFNIRDFCNGESLRLVKVANRHIINAVQDYSREKNMGRVVFFSQADEKSICYYLNPPNSIREKLERYKDKPCTVEQFVEEVCNKSGQRGKIVRDVVEYYKPEYPQAEEALLYAIEKVNAISRTFHPYSIPITKDKILVELSSTNGYKEFAYKDVENIVGMALTKMKDHYEQLYNKVQPQKDICIDILCKSKDEILIHSMNEMIGDDTNTLVIYLSKGTESDIPMIFNGYSSKYNFIAIGSDAVSERLKRSGVIPFGESTTIALKNVLEFLNSERNVK